MKKILGSILITALLFSVSLAVAAPGKRGAPDFVPQLTEDKLTKVVLIRYAPAFARDKPCNYNGVCESGEGGWCTDCRGGGGEDPPEEPSGCYDFLAGSKPRWNWVENYSYSDGLGQVSDWGTSLWNSATGATIFGGGSEGNYPWGEYDYVNSVSLGDYPEEGVMGVAMYWFRGKNLYEYDIQLDTDFFPDYGFDLETVMLHEFGHAAGLSDLYDVSCDDQVMYWQYQGLDRDLGSGDIAGIQVLYGP